MSDYSPTQRAPWWFAVIVVICMLPAISIFAWITNAPQLPNYETAKVLIWLYPIFVIASGIIAWVIYPQRKPLAWILLILMVLSHAAMYVLLNYPAQ